MKTHIIIHTKPDGSIGSIKAFMRESDADFHYQSLMQKHPPSSIVWGRTQLEGFESYLETHYEMVQAITLEHTKDNPQGVVRERHDAQGHGGLYELAEELTWKFERQHEFSQWDGDFLETIEDFISENLSIQLKDTDYVVYDKDKDHVLKFWTGDVAIFSSHEEAMKDCRGNETVVRCTDLPNHWQEKILTQIQKSK